MNVVAAIAIARKAWKARRKLAEVDKKTDKHRDKLKEKIIARGAGKAASCLLVLLLCASGCATSSVRAVREAGGTPTRWEALQLNACDTVSWLNGFIPFGGGQD